MTNFQKLTAAFCLASIVNLQAGYAVDPDEVLQDLALEQRAREISKGLRCVVCKNQSIDQSDASLAKDLRLLVRERLMAGDSNEEVTSYIVDRYGEFVLLRPQFSSKNLFLWGAPLFMLGAGGFLAVYFLRQQKKPAAEPQPLDADEQVALADLIKNQDES